MKYLGVFFLGVITEPHPRCTVVAVFLVRVRCPSLLRHRRACYYHPHSEDNQKLNVISSVSECIWAHNRVLATIEAQNAAWDTKHGKSHYRVLDVAFGTGLKQRVPEPPYLTLSTLVWNALQSPRHSRYHQNPLRHLPESVVMAHSLLCPEAQNTALLNGARGRYRRPSSL
ncbi:hypothetical protein HD806DRAFT_108123 [Xylariaceae sp. AK1471]|nr:hypothetical protein HD806DRAFT_108123 [Xylariaceae sp. AK1471]